MAVTLILLFICLIVYGTVIIGPEVVNRKIEAARGSSGPILRSAMLHSLVKYGSICVSQLSIHLDKPVPEIEKEIEILKKSGIIAEKHESPEPPYEPSVEPIYSFSDTRA